MRRNKKHKARAIKAAKMNAVLKNYRQNNAAEEVTRDIEVGLSLPAACGGHSGVIVTTVMADPKRNLPEHMNLDTVELINEIMIRPEIWMSKHPANKNKWKTLRKWEDMKNSKFPVFTVDDLKKRWKNIKDQYRKELKKIPPGRAADASVSGWKYFDYMKFLKEELAVYKDKEMEPEVEVDALTDCSGSQDFQMSSCVEVHEIKPEYVESPQHSDHKSDEEVEPSAQPARPRAYQPPKEMREELLKIEQRKLQILEAEVVRAADFMKSDNYQFLMSILPEMEKLPSVHKMRLRTRISQAVLDELTSYERSKYSTLDPIQVEVKEEPINMYD